MHESPRKDPVLMTRGLTAAYGESVVLSGVDIEVYEGEVVALLGRNGAGKTTTLRSLIGLMDNLSGQVRFKGHEILSRSPEQIGRLGLAYCPEQREIYRTLSVEENLILPPVVAPGGMSVDEIYGLFPRLKERRKNRGTDLSGGEQQMLAIARILRTGATVFMLDEPTEGLAPIIVQHVGEIIKEMRKRGMTILLVEQNLRFASSISDRFYVLEQGRIVDKFERAKLDGRAEALKAQLSL